MKKTILLSLLSFGFIAFTTAQTGPGGVGNSSSNILWLDASQLSLNDGDPVSNWSDVSGNGNDAIQPNSTNQPFYRASHINNRPSIHFVDNGNDYLDLTTHITDSNITTFMVFRKERHMPSSVLTLKNHEIRGTQNDFYFLYENKNNQITKANSTYHIFGMSTSLPSDTGTITTWNGSTIKTEERSGFLSNTSSSIGAPYNGQNWTIFRGHIAEVILFNEELNSAKRKIVGNYLSSKYNLSTVQALYSYKSNYGHNVNGIGQEADGNNTEAKGNDSLKISNPSNLNNGEYLFTGHNNSGFTTVSSTPSSVVERWSQVWRADKTGTPGLVDLEFFVGANDFSAPGSYVVLIENNDGDFANGGVDLHQTGLSYNSSTQSVKFTGVDLPDGAYFTLGEKAGLISSTGNGNWNDPNIWSCECVPSLEDLVITDDSVIISSNQSVLDVQINSGGSITFSGSDTLFVHGDFTIDGKLYEGDGTIAAVRDDGVGQDFINNSGETINFNNLYVNNSDSLFLINGDWSLTNSLRVTAAGMNVQGANSMTLVSNASKTSEILPSMSNAFTGDFIVQRYISSRNANYANLSAPITNATVADLDDDLYLSGVGGNDGDINTGSGIFRSMFFFDRVNDTQQAITSTSTTLPTTRGFEVYLADTVGSFYGKTIDYIGTPYSGSSVYALVDQGWNLLGNPYHSHFNWEEAETGAFVPYDYYIYNSSTGTYDFYTAPGTPLIAPSQGFWVNKSAFGTKRVYFAEEDKVTSNSSAFVRKKRIEPNFNLSISNSQNPYKHKMRVAFDAFATAEMDENDAPHLPSPIKEAPAIYSMAVNSDEELIKNALNPTEESQLVPISIYAGVAGDYEVSADNLDALYNNYSCVYLKDNETEEAVDLMVEPNYAFEAKKGKSDRFHLILSNSYDECQEMIKNGEFNQKLDTKVSLRNAYEDWYLDYTLGQEQTQLEVRIYNMSGQEVKAPQSFEANGAGTYPLQNLNDLDGIYLIQVIGKDVFLNKQVKL